ncbi:adenosine kinase [Prochlorococcus sp. AH-716-E13]|nr:adenosine kinase [Prochlorococcus sp. AH-716-E13]
MEEKYNHFDPNKDIDLIGIGNAIVDIIVNVEDKFLEINTLKKGSMNLINSNKSEALLKNCSVIKKISGGSSANTVVCLAELENNVQFIGRVKNDAFGNFFSNDIKKSKTIFNTPPINKGPSSAHSIIFITPDAQRTMCTYLGASIEFEPKDVDYNLIKNSKYLYLEGYLWDSDLAKNAFIQAAKIAKESNTKIILSLSDSFCVERHRESFLKLIENYIDIVFCNESELLSLYKKYDLQNCQQYISSICELVIITLGSKGSLIINKGKSEEIKPKLLGKKIIDTTGAGDLYAGGFIHGLINNYSIKNCGEIGAICAGHIITQLGSRSNINLQNLLRDHLV